MKMPYLGLTHSLWDRFVVNWGNLRKTQGILGQNMPKQGLTKNIGRISNKSSYI